MEMPQQLLWLLLQDKFCGVVQTSCMALSALMPGGKSPQEFWPVHEILKWMMLE